MPEFRHMQTPNAADAMNAPSESTESTESTDLRLELSGLAVTRGERTILADVSATLKGGEVVAIIGRNGCGKTTLLKAAAGLLPYSGKAELIQNGRVLPRSHVAYLPQLAEVRSRLTVFEMVMLGLVRNLGWRVSDEVLEKVDRTLHLMHIERHANDPVASLSGGQKQLVFMAQAFVSDPKALLLDEPTSALDLRHQLIVMEAARGYARRTGAVVAAVVHDLFLAARFADRLLMIDEGRVRAWGTPEDVLTPDVLDEVYRVDAAVEKNSLGWLSVIPKRAKWLASELGHADEDDHGHDHDHYGHGHVHPLPNEHFFDAAPEHLPHEHSHDHAHAHEHGHAHEHTHTTR